MIHVKSSKLNKMHVYSTSTFYMEESDFQNYWFGKYTEIASFGELGFEGLQSILDKTEF